MHWMAFKFIFARSVYIYHLNGHLWIASCIYMHSTGMIKSQTIIFTPSLLSLSLPPLSHSPQARHKKLVSVCSLPIFYFILAFAGHHTFFFPSLPSPISQPSNNQELKKSSHPPSPDTPYSAASRSSWTSHTGPLRPAARTMGQSGPGGRGGAG